MPLDSELSFVPGFPEELKTAEGLRGLALLRIHAAILIQNSDDPHVGLEQLLCDAEALLRAADQGDSLGESDGRRAPLDVVARQAGVLRNVALGACRVDGRCEDDERVIDELSLGLEWALEPWVEQDSEERDRWAEAALARRKANREDSAP